MPRLRTAIAALAAASVLATAGGAQASIPAPAAADQALAYVEEVAYEQPMSPSREPLGPRRLVASASYAPSGEVVRLASSLGRQPDGKERRALQGTSCKSIWATRIGKSLFGFTIWKYTQEKYFCWSYPRLTTVAVSAYPCCTDPTWHWRRQIGSAGWCLSWAGSSKGGHYSFRQGLFEQTVAGHVIDSAQPWVKLWVYGNGSWSYQTGS